jgi:hypothetical protein
MPGGGTSPIEFYPAGTTSNVRLLLRNEQPLYIAIELRGLTGVSRAGDVLGAEELPP